MFGCLTFNLNFGQAGDNEEKKEVSHGMFRGTSLSESRQSQPLTAEVLQALIVNYLIGSYDNRMQLLRASTSF